MVVWLQTKGATACRNAAFSSSRTVQLLGEMKFQSLRLFGFLPETKLAIFIVLSLHGHWITYHPGIFPVNLIAMDCNASLYSSPGRIFPGKNLLKILAL